MHLRSFLPQMLLSIMTLQMSNLDVLGDCVVSFLGIEYILCLRLEENVNCAGALAVLVVLIADVVVV